MAEICQEVLCGFGMPAELTLSIVVQSSRGKVTSGTAVAMET